MKKKLAVWEFILKNLQNRVSTLLLYVIESKGSSPGRQGFFMAIDSFGQLEGSIGGGIMEFKFVELAKQILKEEQDALLVKRQVHDKESGANKSGMICSGEQTLLVYSLSTSDIEFVQQIVETLQKNKNGLLSFSPTGLHFTENFSNLQPYYFLSEEDWLYTEKIGYHHHLYIIGGGHCSLSLSNLMAQMDYYITVIDNRKALNTMERNLSAHKKIIVSDFDQVNEIVPSGDHIFVVVMTFGYRTDDEVVRALFGKRFKYFGLMGSRTKVDKMFETYRNENISPEELEQIHSPIGIPIHSKTTEEIAVSIAAEIIREKNR